MERTKRAISYFQEGFNCAQAILAAFGPKFGLDEKIALKMATPFGGGVADTGNVCGAVTGALMVLGLRYGVDSPKKRFRRARAYWISKKFMERFGSKEGSVICSELLKTGRSARKKNEGSVLCPTFVQTASEILENIL